MRMFRGYSSRTATNSLSGFCHDLMKIFLAGLIFFMLAPGSFAQTFMPAKEAGEEICVNKKDGKARCKRTFTTERSVQGGKTIYKVNLTGVGDYDKYTDVNLRFTCEMEERGDFLFTLTSTQAILDKNNNLIVEYRKDYDYPAKKISYRAIDKDGKVIAKKTFPIKGRVVDDVGLGYYLKTVAAHIDDKDYRHFYLLSSEPALYEINVKKIGYEDFTSFHGKVVALKIRLIPDFGILTGVTGVLVPPTYFWFGKEAPYENLAYEGLETGLGSAHVIITTIKEKRQ